MPGNRPHHGSSTIETIERDNTLSSFNLWQRGFEEMRLNEIALMLLVLERLRVAPDSPLHDLVRAHTAQLLSASSRPWTTAFAEAYTRQGVGTYENNWRECLMYHTRPSVSNVPARVHETSRPYLGMDERVYSELFIARSVDDPSSETIEIIRLGHVVDGKKYEVEASRVMEPHITGSVRDYAAFDILHGHEYIVWPKLEIIAMELAVCTGPQALSGTTAASA